MTARAFVQDSEEEEQDDRTPLGRFFANRNAAIDSEGPDLFGEDRPKDGSDAEPRRGRALSVLLSLIAFAAFAALLWYAYNWAQGPVDPAKLPVVAAEEAPIKVKPEDEGGMAVGLSPLMTPWGSVLSDEQIWTVVAFMRSLADPPYTGAMP